MESVILALIVACLALVLVLLWLDADARYYANCADRYRELWYREMDRHTETIQRYCERRDPADPADWWKGEDA